MSEQLEKFNNVYEDLLKDIKNTYKDFNIKSNSNNDSLKHFITNVIPYLDDISCKNIDAFMYKHKGMYLVDGVKFYKLLKHKKTNNENLNVIWKYLQTLYVLAYNSRETKNILDKLNDNGVNNDEVILNNMEKSNYLNYLENFINNDGINILPEKHVDESTKSKKVESISDDEDSNEKLPDFLENSLIGSLAKELSNEINPEELGEIGDPSDLISSLFGGGGDNPGLGALIGKVVGKLDEKMKSGDVDQNALMNEATSMMQNLNLFGGGNGSGAPDMSGLMSMMAGMNGMGGIPTQTAPNTQNSVPVPVPVPDVPASNNLKKKKRKGKKGKRRKN